MTWYFLCSNARQKESSQMHSKGKTGFFLNLQYLSDREHFSFFFSIVKVDKADC